ncbi:cyclic 2,3-diphosphoglycerate synthetase [Candidatus Bipolaricaulota bacterium]|nr:cyclic 2,3-diphosphoglycerate synthetase [Candidatus Bipolaricaulota bacterium]
MPADRGLTPFVARLVKDMDVLALIDGEHYPPVVQWALSSLQDLVHEVRGLVFLGGTEKITNRGDAIEGTYDLPIYYGRDLEALPLEEIKTACLELVPDLVLDLSGEPVVDYDDRFRIASTLGEVGIPYCGADFYFNPPVHDLELESETIGITGTDKRVGKTAVSVTLVDMLKEQGYDPVVVSMGRGGPTDPDLIKPDGKISAIEGLMKASRSGRHAASDYWEDALLTGVPTIGCRRCGGGMIGQPFISNVEDGARLADKLGGDPIIFEGSGSTIPPVATDSNVLVVGGGGKLEHTLGYFGEYRIRRADVVLITMAEEPTATRRKIDRIKRGVLGINPKAEIVESVFRPEVLGDVMEKSVFLATTAPESVLRKIEQGLAADYHVNVVGSSNNLSDRVALRKDLSSGLENAEVLLTEIKAGSVNVAMQTALELGLDVGLLHNRLEVTGGTITTLSEVVDHLYR